MSALATERLSQEVYHAPVAPTRSRGFWGGIRSLIVLVFKAVVGTALCFHYLGSVLVVGWTCRLMRRRILHGWWRWSPPRDSISFPAFAARQGRGAISGPLPNWIVSERFGDMLRRPGPTGEPPGAWRKLCRVPRALLDALVWNLRAGLGMLAGTYVLTLPACLIWMTAWFNGWQNSFTKGNEFALVGLFTGVLGVLVFIAAMLYVPMAWAHVAATADARAFFQFSFVSRLIRHRLGASVRFAAIFSLVMLPVSVFRVAPSFFASANPALESLDAAGVRQFMAAYEFACGSYVFLAFVAVHLLAARMYRSAVLALLRRDPATAGDLHPSLYRALGELDLIPAGPPPRRHPLVAVLLGTGRWGTRPLLWLAALVLWFTVVAQIFIAAFLNFIPLLSWLNQPLLHLPSMYFLPS